MFAGNKSQRQNVTRIPAPLFQWKPPYSAVDGLSIRSKICPRKTFIAVEEKISAKFPGVFVQSQMDLLHEVRDNSQAVRAPERKSVRLQMVPKM